MRIIKEIFRKSVRKIVAGIADIVVTFRTHVSHVRARDFAVRVIEARFRLARATLSGRRIRVTILIKPLPPAAHPSAARAPHIATRC